MISEASKFTENILAAAKQKAETIVNEAVAETQQALEEAKTHLSREAQDIIRNARQEAESIRRRQMSEIRHRLKLQEQLEKSKILSEVLEQTKKHVTEIASDDSKYLPFLVDLVESGVRELDMDQAVIHLNAKDLKPIDKAKLERDVNKRLGKPAKLEWSKEPIEAMGGAIVSSSDGRTRIVNTFDERFEALESKLLIEAGKLLFGD